jgi:hypothetical protein
MADPTGGSGSGSGTPMDPKTLETVKNLTEGIKKNVRETTDSFTDQQKIIDGLRDVLNKMSEDFEKLDTSSTSFFSPENWKKVEKDLDKTQKEAKGLNGVVEKAAKTLNSKYTPAVTAAAGALTGLRQGFKNVSALMKGGASIFSSVVDSLWQVGKAIIAIPFGMLKSLTDMAQNGMGGNELAAAMEKVREEFGAFSSVSSSAIISTSKEMKGFSDTGLSAWRVFGNLAQVMEKVTAVAKAMGPQFAANAEEFKKNGGALLAYQKGLGIADDAMAGIAVRGASMGKDMGTVLNDMTKQSYGLAKAFGLDAKVISRDMSKAMQDMGHFGHLSNKELAASVTYANKLGISFDKMTALMDKFATFDSAAESVSTLNEQFGTNIDAMELMSAQSTAEKMEILRKSFQATGKDLAKMSYQERMLIAQQSGLEIGVLDTALAQKNQGVSLAKIKTESEKAAEATLTQADAMKKLSDAIERLTPSGEKMGGFLEHLLKGFTLGVQQIPEFRELMMNVNRSLMIVYQTGIKLGKMFVENFPGLKDFIKGLRDMFNPAKFQSLADGVMKVLNDFAGDKGDFSSAFEKLMKNLKKTFFDFFDSESQSGKQVLGAMKKMGLAVVNIFAEMSKWAIRELADMLKVVVAFIKDPKMPDVSGAGAAVSPWVKPLLDVFKTFADTLWPVLKDMASAIFDKIKHALLETKTGQKMIGGAVALLLGPAILQGVVGAMSGGLAKQAGGLIVGGLGKGIGAAAQAAKGKAAMSTAIEATTAALPSKEATEKMEAASNSKINFPAVMKMILGVAGLMAVGLVSFMAALAVVKNVKVEDILKAGLVLAVVGKSMEIAASGAASLMMASRTWGSEQSSILKGLAAVSAIMAIGLVSFFGAMAIVRKFNVGLKDIGIVSSIFLAMDVVMLAAGGMALAAMALGAVMEAGGAEVILPGLLAMAAVMVTGLAPFLLGLYAVKKIGADPTTIDKTIAIFQALPLVMGASALVAGAAMALGLALAGPQAALVLIGLLGMAGIMAGGMFAFLAAVKKVQAANIQLGDIAVVQAIMDTMSRLFDQAVGFIKSAALIGILIVPLAPAITVGMFALAKVMNGIIDMGKDVIKRSGEIDGSGVQKFGMLMDVMMELFKKAGMGITAAALIGTYVVGTFGIGGLAILAGMKAIQMSIDYMVGTVIGLMNSLSLIKEDPNAVLTKSKAFAEIMGAIGNLTNSVGAIFKSMDFGFFESGDSINARLDKANQVIKTMIEGSDGKSGFKGMVDKIIDGIKEIPEQKLQAAGTIGQIFSGIASLIGGLTGPIGEIQDKMTHWYQTAETDQAKIKTAMDGLTNFLTTIMSSITNMVTSVSNSVAGIPADKIEVIKATGPIIGSIIQSMSQMITSIMSSLSGMTRTTKTEAGDVTSLDTYGVMAVANAINSIIAKIANPNEGLISIINSIMAKIENLDIPSKAKMETMEKIMGMIGTVSSFVGNIFSAMKPKTSTTSTKKNFDRNAGTSATETVKTISEGTPTIVEVFKSVQTALPDLIKALAAVIDDPALMKAGNADFAAKITSVTKIFDIIKSVSEVFKTLSGMGVNITFGMLGDRNLNETLRDTFQKLGFLFYDLAHGWGGKESPIKQIIESVSTIDSMMSGKNGEAGETLKRVNSMFSSITASAKTFEGLKNSLDAAQKMFEKANELSDALSKGDAAKIKTSLTALSDGLALGGAGKYTINNKDVVINVEMTVTMKVDDVEQILINRKKSVIRDRINAAIEGVPKDKVQQATIGYTPANNAQPYSSAVAQQKA